MTTYSSTTVVPVYPLDPELAKAADVGRDGLICIGYWRCHPDPEHPTASGSYAHSVKSAKEDLETCRHGGHVPFNVYDDDLKYAGVSTEEEYLEWRLERAKAKAAAQHRLPWPGDHVDETIGEDERERVAALLPTSEATAA